MMARQNPARAAIAEAIALVERNGMPLTPKNVRANVDTQSLTIGDATEALQRYISTQIPLMLKEQGKVIVDAETRERQDYWTSTRSDLEEQLRIKRESSLFDLNRIKAEEAVIEFLREKEGEFGYAVYPGLFEEEISRIYSMHSLTMPARISSNGEVAA